jgi:hypothetical protein
LPSSGSDAASKGAPRGRGGTAHPCPGRATFHYLILVTEGELSGIARLLAPLTAHEAPAVLSPHPDDAAWLQQTALQLLDEHRALGRRPLDVHHALRRSLLESLLLRLANSPGIAPAVTGRGDTYGRFVDALELHFRELHRAADYAELLGCSKPGACWEVPGGMPGPWPSTSASPIPRTSAASSATAPV